WLACPTCGGELADAENGVRCTSCGTFFGRKGRWYDLVDPKQKVSAEGPGEPLAMGRRARRRGEVPGPPAPGERGRPAAGSRRPRAGGRGPGPLPAGGSGCAPELAIRGLDLWVGAMEEAERVVGSRPNVALVRASSRRRLPVKDDSCDVVLRRLAPALPEE